MSAGLTTPITRRLMLKRAAQLGSLGAAAPLAMNLAAIGEAATYRDCDVTDEAAVEAPIVVAVRPEAGARDLG